MRGNFRHCFLLLAFLFLIPCSGSLEPVSLGNGIREDVMNLDMGASQPGYKPFITHTGFVSPPVPQIMALSPSAMVHQARALRDEAEAMRNEASDILQKTEAAALNAKRDAEAARSLAEAVQADANSCAEKADLVDAMLDETRAIYNETSALALMVSAIAEKNEALANHTAMYAAEARHSLNESRQIQAQIAFKADELEALYAKYQILDAQAPVIGL